MTRRQAHMERLVQSCRGASIPQPDLNLVESEIDIACGHVEGETHVRVMITGDGRRVITAIPADISRLHAPVRARRGPHRDEPFLGGSIKHGSRAPWVIAVLQSEVDEVLLVDDEERFTEGTRSSIFAVIDGVLWTAPHDSRILRSTTALELLASAHALDIPVCREGPPAQGPWDALYIASTTRHLAPVIELDGAPLPAWDPVGKALANPNF
jgi:branched-subunit amino acid aminotransferase/4-amino-4-deoxychorismate lyase